MKCVLRFGANIGCADRFSLERSDVRLRAKKDARSADRFLSVWVRWRSAVVRRVCAAGDVSSTARFSVVGRHS